MSFLGSSLMLVLFSADHSRFPPLGSGFDLAGRVAAGVPAPTNLIVPPYRFSSDTEIIVGELEADA